MSAGMVLLALLGVLTIFHGPLAALLFPPVVAPESFAGPPATAPAAR